MGSRKIRVSRLGHIVYQHSDVTKAVAFLTDFGLVEVHRTADRVYLRGHGVEPYIYVAEKSPDDRRHCIGGFWVVDTFADLEMAASMPGATPISHNDGPGGGQMVTVTDPNGFTLGFLYGQCLRQIDEPSSAAPVLENTVPVPNYSMKKPRKGQWRRFRKGACPVHRLGHYGFVVPTNNYEKTVEFYTNWMNLKRTDAVFDPVTGKIVTYFFHIDLGQEHTDHHSFFLGAGPDDEPSHIHHSSFEVNDIDSQVLGHDWLRGKGWTNCWGVGRHVLGSQVFDYWFDSSGNILEHYSDGDLVNEDTPFGKEPAGPLTLHIWGPDVPLAFLSGRVEDAGKSLSAPPDVLQAMPALYESVNSKLRLGA